MNFHNNLSFLSLQVGETGERERVERLGPFGYPVYYNKVEHSMPEELNHGYRAKMRYRYGTTYGKEVKQFIRRWREKQHYILRNRQM